MRAIFLDIETTGLDPSTHRVLEIAFKIIDLTTGYEITTYQQVVKQSFEVWELRDPTSLEINGFSWDKVTTGIEEEAVAEEIIKIFTDHKIVRGETVYICQNPAFDRNFFTQLIDIYTQEHYKWPYHWLDFASMYWALQVKSYHDKQEPFPKELNLSKNAIAPRYQLPIEPIPHSAINGVDHLILCYKTVIGFG